MDGTRKPFNNKLQGSAPTLKVGVGSLLHARKKSWVRVCSLNAGGPY